MFDTEEIRARCFGQHVRMAARAVTRALDARLQSADLRITQFALLGTIAARSDCSIAAMARQVDIEPSALQRNLAVMEGRGWLEPGGGRGRRGRRFELTPAGEAKLAEAMPIWRAAQAELSGHLGPDAEAMLQTLRNLEKAALTMEGTRI